MKINLDVGQCSRPVKPLSSCLVILKYAARHYPRSGFGWTPNGAGVFVFKMARQQIPRIGNHVTDPRGFGFPANLIQSVILRATQRGEIVFDGKIIMKLYQRTTVFCTDIIGVSLTDAEGPQVDIAVRLFSDFSESPTGDCAPLENIKRFADRFGLDQLIAGKQGKFFLCETITLSNPDKPQKLMSVLNPLDHAFIDSNFATVEGATVRIALAFATDTTQYRQWVESH